ncbi:hypothetical protein [Dryocola sp. LX212]
MTTYNTRNPLGSAAAKDLYDNAENMDHRENDRVNEVWDDRFGTSRLTWYGIEKQNERAIASYGWILIDSFQDGATLTLPNQVLRWALPDGDGEYYRWDGVFPKDVPADSTPESTGGIGTGAWIGVGDASLRSNLSASGGAQLVGNAAIAVRDMTTLKAAAWTKVGQLYDLQSYVDISSGGRGYWLAVETSGVTPNDIDAVQSTANTNVSFVFQPTNGVVDIRQLGAVGGGDVTAILNRVMSNNSYRIVTASKQIGDDAFVCSGTVNLVKSFICEGVPQFDFASTAVDTPSFYSGNTTISDVEFSGFEILNSQHVALRGKGDRVTIRRIKCTNSKVQAINWQGNNWSITYCHVSGVAGEFGILNGGNSQEVEIAFNFVEGVTNGGAYELGYTASDARVHHNSSRNCKIAFQLYQHTTGGVSTASDVTVCDNNFKSSSLHAIHVNCGVTGDGFFIRNVRIERNNINTAGTTGILIEKGSTDTLLIDNVITDVTGNFAIQVTSFLGYLEIHGGFLTRCNQGIYMQQDGMDVNGVRIFNMTYDAIAWPIGNAFTSQSIRNCYIRTIGRDFIRNFNYASYPTIKDFNNIKMPLTGVAQMNGATVVAGQVYFIDTAASGQAPGFYVIGSGVVGSGALTRNMAALSSS